MPKASKGKKFYAVQNGRENGVYLTWEDCEKQTKGFPGAKYRSFANAADAEAFVNGTLSKDHGPSAPSTSSSSVLAALNSKGKKRTLPSDIADESTCDVVYCDGACKGNGQADSIAGVGVWWEENDPRNIAERCPGDQTNNRAELIAIVRMLETTPKSKRPLLIKTDSQYCIKCFFQWLPKWKRNNFRTAGGHAVRNAEIIVYVSALLEARALMGQPVRMEYVKGHSGNRGNDGADAQANKGALLPPVPERDWAKAKQELLERLEEERRFNEGQPTSVPLNADVGVSELSTNQPHKVRKVSHDPSSSRSSLAPTSTELSNLQPIPTDSIATQARSPSLPRVASPSLLFPIIEVSSSPEIDPSPIPPASEYAQAESQPENATAVTDISQLSKTNKLPRTETPIRKHGMGLFTTTPPPNADIVRKFSTLPHERQGVKRPKSVPKNREKDKKMKAMHVDVADVDLNEATKSEPVNQDQEGNEKQMVRSADTENVDFNLPSAPKTPIRKHGMGLFTTTPPPNADIVRRFSTLPQEENEKPMAEDAANDHALVVSSLFQSLSKLYQHYFVNEEATKSESATKDQKNNEKPIMSVDAANDSVIEAKGSKSVPKDQEETEESMTINEDIADVGPKVEEVQVPESVSTDQEAIEKSMAINEKARDAEPMLNDQGKAEKPMVIGMDAADVDLIVSPSFKSSSSNLKVSIWIPGGY
ncbi:hypothetical protein C0992_003199 [Termitomyces sp. T32_za158]|nr:hypothetical protein C0992_003199 [Termitomyces sp. T32_za158]